MVLKIMKAWIVLAIVFVWLVNEFYMRTREPFLVECDGGGEA